MEQVIPNHYSKLLLNDNIGKNMSFTDRSPYLQSLLFLFFGVLVGLSGIYDIVSYESQNIVSIFSVISGENVPDSSNISSSSVFGYWFIFIGIGLAIIQFMMLRRKKTIVIKDGIVTVDKINFFGQHFSFSESLDNYIGLRYRTFLDSKGMFAKIQHIIELNHEDENKTIPLFIAYKDPTVRERWERMARELKKPAIINSADGDIIRPVEDLDKPIRILAQEGKISDDFSIQEPIPNQLSIKHKRMRTLIRQRGFTFDIHNFIYALMASAFVVILVLSIKNSDLVSIAISPTIFNSFLVIALITPFSLLIMTHRLEINGKKLRHYYVWPLLKKKKATLRLDKAEDIEIYINPKTNLRFIGINSDERTIHFGEKLSDDTLFWLKRYLTHVFVTAAPRD